MQRQLLFMLLILTCLVPAKNRKSVVPAAPAASDTAITALPAAPANDTLKAVPPPATAPATDSTAEKIPPADSASVAAPTHDTAQQAVPPPPPSSDTVAVARDSASHLPATVAQDSSAHPPVFVVDSLAEAKDRAYRDSLRTAREELQNTMEWHVVSDSGTAATVTPLAAEPVQETTRVAPASQKRSSIPFPDIPEDQESRVLMYTGVSLAVVGLATFLLFNNTDGVKDATSVTTPAANQGDANAPTQKTMTIKWAQ